MHNLTADSKPYGNLKWEVTYWWLMESNLPYFIGGKLNPGDLLKAP